MIKYRVAYAQKNVTWISFVDMCLKTGMETAKIILWILWATIIGCNFTLKICI